MKQAILVIRKLKLPKGKMGVQIAHAACEAVLKSDKIKIAEWRYDGSMKIVIYVESEKELYKYKGFAEDLDIVTAVITDAGRTVIAPGTVTCMAIGPDIDDKIDKVIGELKLV